MQKKTFMIIDDSSIDRFVHTKLLQVTDFCKSIKEFSNGMAALEFLKLNQDDEDELPDIILLDIMMPEMDGFDFLIHFEGVQKKLMKLPKIFMLSSSEDENDQKRASNNRFVERLLKKPFSPKSFKEHFSRLKF